MSATDELTDDVLPERLPVKAEVQRTSGIGGSEISAVMGLNPYMSAHDLWLVKTGQAPEKPDTAPMRWGRLLQRAIGAAYEEDTGKTLVVCFDEPRRHPSREIVIGTPDALLPEEKRVVEFKAPGLRQAYRYGEPGTDQVPDEHLLQAAWYMALMNYDLADLAVLFGGQRFSVFQIRRDAALEDALMNAAETFWRVHVVGGVAPTISDTEMARAWLRKAFPKHRLPLREATEEEQRIAWAYRSARRAREENEKQEADFAAQLKLVIGDAEGLEGDGFRITYRAAKESEVTDWKAVAGEYGSALRLIAAEREAILLGKTVEKQLAYDMASAALSSLEDAKRFTTTRPGSRRFLPKFDDQEEERNGKASDTH